MYELPGCACWALWLSKLPAAALEMTLGWEEDRPKLPTRPEARGGCGDAAEIPEALDSEAGVARINPDKLHYLVVRVRDSIMLSSLLLLIFENFHNKK